MAGLSFQVFSLVLFATATVDYYFLVRKNYRNGAPPPKGAHPRIKWFFLALTFAYTCIMIRCIYRVIELSDGWNSALMKDEVLYVILEGMWVLLPFSPSLLPYSVSFGRRGPKECGNTNGKQYTTVWSSLPSFYSISSIQGNTYSRGRRVVSTMIT